MHEAAKLTEAQAKIMRHALGLDQKRESYRNYYVVSVEDDVLLSLIRLGYMACTYQTPSGNWTYSVTPAGRIALEKMGGSHD